MTFECRNGVKTGANRYAMVLDVSSTSSDDEDVRMLRELKGFYFICKLKFSVKAYFNCEILELKVKFQPV